jgi:hypothetical protein
MSLGYISSKTPTTIRIESHAQLDQPLPKTNTNSLHTFSVCTNAMSLVLLFVAIILNIAVESTSIFLFIPLCISALNVFIVLPLYPTWSYTVNSFPYYIVVNLICIVLLQSLDVLLNYIVAFWASFLILICLIPLKKNEMINYNFDTMDHTLSCMTSYGFLRGLSAYFVILGLPQDASDLIPVMIATLETILMYLCKAKSYQFDVHSELFFHYAVLKSTVFVSVPQIEKLILSELT